MRKGQRKVLHLNVAEGECLCQYLSFALPAPELRENAFVVFTHKFVVILCGSSLIKGYFRMLFETSKMTSMKLIVEKHNEKDFHTWVEVQYMYLSSEVYNA